MRTEGKITHWNPEKGYGFITPNAGAKHVFAHISAFTNRTLPPRTDQLVIFTLSTDKRGRPCAIEVTRVGEPLQKTGKRRPRSGSARNLFASLVIVLLIGAVGYSRYQKSQTGTYVPVRATAPASRQFHCDGRTHCSQMTSCDEATYFIRNCPNTQMDGDGDGVPCESQWCN